MSFQSAKNHLLDNPQKIESIVDECLYGHTNETTLWLVQAIAHGFCTGDWLYVTAQIKRHIEPDIETEASALATKWALEKERDRADQSMDDFA